MTRRLPPLPASHPWDPAAYNRLLEQTLNRVDATSDIANPVRGMSAVDLDTMEVFVYYGATTGWARPWHQPWGHVSVSSYFDNATSGTTALTAGSTAPTSLIANRLHHVVWWTEALAGTVNADTFSLDVTKDSTSIVSATTANVTSAGSFHLPGGLQRFFTTSAASHTYRAVAQRTAGTGVLGCRGYLVVTDAGPNGAAPND